ncbi:thioesterase II family protein [Paucibacter sp. XJ19-41]|uniref:thioesterase II family protein n=1 Tax=Paucibacter sp. XJ19-41 TaxID=2927824 RepID=UPI002349DC2F|nr:alpha/beta fold hydrolase [Paucibacter sp. XJ19-41]MDC6169387.1 alpha/beta fold hydrolase [Paucibacter sp. XJ19-41]
MSVQVSLLSLPCAGASATMYLRWRSRLPAWLRLVPVELPGRGARMGESLLHDADQLVELLCSEHAGVLQGPYALFGHSMGGLLAHAMAARWQARGQPAPLAVFVSACPAPTRRERERFAGSGDEAWLIADLLKQGGTPTEVLENPELRRIVLGVLAADYQVCESACDWPMQAPLRAPLVVLGGLEDDIAAERLEAWRCETTHCLALHWFSGGHFFLRPHECEVLALIERQLAMRNHEGRYAGLAFA